MKTKVPVHAAKRHVKKAVHKHEREMHPGKPLTKLPGGRVHRAKRGDAT